MEHLVKALLEMKELIKKQPFVPSIKPAQPLTPPSIKQIKPTQVTASTSTPKIPGIEPSSKKDPKKVAEQLKNPTERKTKIEMLKFEKNGQWYLE